MTEAEAREEVEMLVQWESDPALSALEVDMLLRNARTIDSAGVKPDEVGWAGSWDVRAAVANGWRLKAGKAAGRFDMNSDVMRLERSQVVEHCMRMARAYGGMNVA